MKSISYLSILDKILGWKFVCYVTITAQKMKFSIKDFFSECDQIRMELRIWSYLLQKSLLENFIFCAVDYALAN